MPIYAYKCAECSHELDVIRKVSDPPLTECPNCGKSALVKQITAAGFHLKGGGWYVTDFRDAGSGKKKDAVKPDEKAKDRSGGSWCRRQSDDQRLTRRWKQEPARPKRRPKRTRKRRQNPMEPANPRHRHLRHRRAGRRAAHRAARADLVHVQAIFDRGLLVWIPLAITFWVLDLIVSTMDQTLLLLPSSWRPDALLPFHIPGIGLVLSLLIVLVTGVLVANIIGERLVRWWHGLLNRIPIVRSIYSSVKQISDTLLATRGQSFRKVVMIEFPQRGQWTLGFVVGSPGATIAAATVLGRNHGLRTHGAESDVRLRAGRASGRCA